MSPIAVVRADYDAIRRRDLPALLETLADHVEWEFPGPEAIPFAGRYEGKTSIKKFFQTIRDTVVVEQFEIISLAEEGASVEARGHERFKVKATGLVWDVD